MADDSDLMMLRLCNIWSKPWETQHLLCKHSDGSLVEVVKTFYICAVVIEITRGRALGA